MVWREWGILRSSPRTVITKRPLLRWQWIFAIVWYFLFLFYFLSCRFFPLTDTAVTERYYTSNTTGVQWIFPIVWYFLFLFYFLHVDLFLSPTVLLPNVTIWLTRRVSYKKQELGSFQVFLMGSLDFPF